MGDSGKAGIVNSDLHAPLGQNRKVRRQRRVFPSGKSLFAMLTLVLVGGFSLYAGLQPSRLQTAALKDPGPAPAKPNVAALPKSPMPVVENQANLGAQNAAPNSGAIVQSTMMADGNVVTKYAPGSRSENGPVSIATSRIGQEKRMASFPNPDLLQDVPEGRIPVVAADGLRPVEQYARPWSGAHGTRVAIIVTGLGVSQTGTQKAIKLLPEEVTLAFASSGNSLARWMQDARRSGHEILLQVPMEPLGYPATDPGRGTLLTGKSSTQVLHDLHVAMAATTNYTGIINYMGGRFLSDAAALEPVMRDISERGLLFLDDGSSAQSLSDKFAHAMNMPHATADLVLDDQVREDAIMKRLDELERVAKRNGSAIGVASAFDESIKAITRWVQEAKARSIEIVGVSAIAMDAQAQ